MKTAYIEISGKVQGVFFRAKAKEIAEMHKISGWVKNTGDGKVVACISGEEKALERFIAWCRHGPERAEVADVVVNYTDVREFDRFKVIR